MNVYWRLALRSGPIRRSFFQANGQPQIERSDLHPSALLFIAGERGRGESRSAVYAPPVRVRFK
jgi:hypothetical protein